jgi:transcriptional regulator GlxA family with amidase domain
MTEPSRRETIVGRGTDEAQLAARRAFVVQFRAGRERAQRGLLGRVDHVSSRQATTFSASTSCAPSSEACSPRSLSGGRTGRGPQRHADLQARIPEHPDPHPPVEAQARRGAMGPRNVLRAVVRKVGMTSERFVERVRVEVARRLPEEASRGVPDVGTARGHRSRAPPSLEGKACQTPLAHSRPRRRGGPRFAVHSPRG